MIRYFGLAAMAATMAMGLVACDMGAVPSPPATAPTSADADNGPNANSMGFEPSILGASSAGGGGY